MRLSPLFALLLIPAGTLFSQPSIAQNAPTRSAFSVVSPPDKPFAVAPVRTAPQSATARPTVRMSPPVVYIEPVDETPELNEDGDVKPAAGRNQAAARDSQPPGDAPDDRPISDVDPPEPLSAPRRSNPKPANN